MMDVEPITAALHRLLHYGEAMGLPGDPTDDFYLAERALTTLETLKHLEPTTNFQDVTTFQQKFQVPCWPFPGLPTPENFRFRKGHLQEELQELEECFVKDDLEGMADALVDLVYVAMGLAVNMGLPWQELWNEVQRANMSKVRATHASQSKRGSTLDIVKPEGWVGPDHKKALLLINWDGRK